MAEYRQIHTHIWKDGWFLELAADEKLFFIYLFSNERASVAGIYTLPLKVMAFESGLDAVRIQEVLRQFGAAGKVHYADGVVWVVNLRRYNETASPKVRLRIEKDLEAIPDCEIKKRYLNYHSSGEYRTHRVSGIASESDSDSASERETETETETETEQETEGEPAPPAVSPDSAPTAGSGTPRSELFEAVIQVCAVDLSVDGSAAAVGDVCTVLARAAPPYTAAEVRKWGEQQAWMTSPPTLNQLRRMIGSVRQPPRNGNGRSHGTKNSARAGSGPGGPEIGRRPVTFEVPKKRPS